MSIEGFVAPPMERNKKRIRSIAVSLRLVVLAALIYVFAHHSSHKLVVRVIDFVVLSLASRASLGPFLVKGVVVLVTMPFFWIIGKYTQGLFGHRELPRTIAINWIPLITNE